MSILKVRSSKLSSWEVIPTRREKVRKIATWKWAAHRGYYSGKLENTIQNMVRAKENGFDYCECDLRFTSDSICVMCHDAAISGVNANGESVTFTVAEVTAEEITELTLQTEPRFGCVHPPRLEAFLDAARVIDMKLILHGSSVTTEAAAKSVAESVLLCGMQGKVVYMPGSLEAAQWIAEVDPLAEIELCYIGHSNIPEDLTPYLTLRNQCAYVGFDLPADYPPTAEDVERLKRSGLDLSYWNVSTGNYKACLADNPRRVTMQDNLTIHNGWDQEYLKDVELW